jgi:cyclic beta-1,2-glucan synthetase
MFEYLMPLLVMRSPIGSLLDQTYQGIVQRQIDYGAERQVPWGVSESGYNARDIEMTYQYSNFGVPGLGLKRGLSDDLVISPYATCLAAMIDPISAADNLHRLAAAGANGKHGFYEALDYTAERLPENEKVAVVRTYMAHHQGMSLVSLNNVLYDTGMRRRFHSDPRVQATELLLQERAPKDVSVTRPHTEETQKMVDVRDHVPSIVRRFRSPHQPSPATHLLSNGRYNVMITTAGSGYSRWRDLAVTRWREDATRDSWGTYIFFRDIKSGVVWSAGYQPTGAEPDDYEVDFSEERVEIVRRDGSLLTTLEVIVSPEDDAEIRRVTLRNVGGSDRFIEVTSYAEMVLAAPAADNLHPAFSNLFVQTEFVAEVNSLLCSRRPRQPTDNPFWAAHVIVVKGDTEGPVQFESDRARFLGRGRSIRTPMCVMDGKPLSNTTGAVLDPVVSLRQRLKIGPGKSAQISFITLVTSSREQALILADKYHDPSMFERTATLAWTQAQVQQHYLGIDPHEAHLFQNLASRILYADALLRPGTDVLKRNTRGASGLWQYGISGDIPIVLVRIDEVEDRDIIRQLLRAYEYWNMKNLAVDLVIVNEKAPSYIQELQTSLEDLVQATQTGFRQTSPESPGRIFLLRADRLTSEDRLLLHAAARLVFLSRHGSLSEQAERVERPDEAVAPLLPKPPPHPGIPEVPTEAATLEFFNGLGGFSKEGHEYVTILGPGQWTPAPWLNVISNPQFGFQVSESGAGFTWSVNSRENQLTPWSNDPVSDPCGEAIYLRDMESGDVWTPTVLPIREEMSPYIARHGQGYSIFEYTSHGVGLKLIQFVPLKDSIKISRLTIENLSKRPRKLSVTGYLEWVLGVSRSSSSPFIVTELDAQTGALFARNSWNSEFAGRVAFADLGGLQTSWTANRTEFLGRHGTHDHPAAIEQSRRLSGQVGAGLDPCAALQTNVVMQPGARMEVTFFLGQAASREEAIALLKQYRAANLDTVLSDVKKQWEGILETVQITTPQRSMDILVNRWLLYQTLACRIWARSGFYQAGGAYGFRDQLQDVMAITVSRRDLARQQILRAAGRQFLEGDVQHWWHPPAGRGVRTHISDDLIWLPYVVNHYIEVTGDTAILEEPVPFIEGQTIPEDKEDAYFQPRPSSQQATLFEHCARALDKSLAVGSHGLPLMGTGDWNDGMNRIGSEGKGESVWLAWFLHTTLWEFAKLAQMRGESTRAERWRLHVGDLKASIEKNGWDGDWYRRAYFDDGTPIGSAENTECRIDSIAQSWGVLSGAADPSRAQRAMAAAEEQLVRRQDKLALLLTPPFDKTPKNPGYIKGYLPGVRENGGQYTHAAVWMVLAFAALGQGEKAVELFNLLNPIHHGNSRSAIHRYKVEPYVIAGDVYSEPPHAGRGGWTWYTGSAGWMYRGAVEWILGVRLRGTTLFLDPCIPPSWPGFEIKFRYHSARYEIKVENPQGVSRGIQHATMDGKPIRGKSAIFLVDDGTTHHISIAMGQTNE